MVMLLAKRSGMMLDRDIIFLAESGEEADPAGVGIPFMVSQHFDEIDAEFALAEGGGARLQGGRVTQMSSPDQRESAAPVSAGRDGHVRTRLGRRASTIR